MKKMNDFKKIVSQTATTTQLYGESGSRSNDASGNVYRISV
ncbi:MULTISPECIES: hypothetical protein [Kosakonia]|nr:MULTISPECIES: hypothetical protein [Kosakonia]